MGSRFMNKMWNLLGVETDDDEFGYEEDYDTAQTAPYEEEKEATVNVAPTTPFSNKNLT